MKSRGGEIEKVGGEMEDGGHLSIAGALHAAVEHDLAMAFFLLTSHPTPPSLLAPTEP